MVSRERQLVLRGRQALVRGLTVSSVDLEQECDAQQRLMGPGSEVLLRVGGYDSLTRHQVD